MKHDEWADVRSALSRPPRQQSLEGRALSAVAMLLTPGRKVWVIRRAERVGDPWSGHLAFPGGRVENTDADLLATAIRETWEELGVTLDPDACIGALDDVAPLLLGRLLVRPFVFVLDAVPEWRPNEEVAHVYSLPFDNLLAGTARGTMRWPSLVGRLLPSVDVEGVQLWGITLRIIDDLLDRIDGGGLGLERLRAHAP